MNQPEYCSTSDAPSPVPQQGPSCRPGSKAEPLSVEDEDLSKLLAQFAESEDQPPSYEASPPSCEPSPQHGDSQDAPHEPHDAPHEPHDTLHDASHDDEPQDAPHDPPCDSQNFSPDSPQDDLDYDSYEIDNELADLLN